MFVRSLYRVNADVLSWSMILPPEEPHFAPWNVVSLEAFVRSIQNELTDNSMGPGVAAIDGRSAGGKTTLATLISRAVPGSVVVHTDDIPSSGTWPGRDAHSPFLTDDSLAHRSLL